MKKSHMKKYFPDWLEGKLSPSEIDSIENHLETCEECKEYFEKMQLFLGKPELGAIPELKPDPFLPTRIKEAAKQTNSGTKFLESLKMRSRLTFGTAMIIIALMVGVFLGKWMSGKEAVSETEIVLSYSSMFSNQGVGEFCDNVVTEQNGEQQ
jgi:predicted anti-sigma-YlaC factor YlaD